MSFRRYKISFFRREIVFVEVVAESKAAAKRIALGKQAGERSVVGTGPTERYGPTIHREEPTDACA